MTTIGNADVAARPLDGAMLRVQSLLAERQVHASRCVVLVPYAQFLPLARAAWARLQPDGFAPRVESTLNWCRGLAGFAPGVDDLSMDAGRDLLTAASLLDRAGLGAHRDALAGVLVEAALQLQPIAAATAPTQRADWVTRMRDHIGSGMEGPALAMEAAVARIALEWAAASTYGTDGLFESAARASADLLVVLEGYQPEPLVQALARRWGDAAVVIPLVTPVAVGHVHLHAATGPEDESERAAACVMNHVIEGRSPVALAATDRTQTRRIRAMLAARGLRLRDETGWKLSTTRAATQVITLLRALRHDASSDAVLDWLKQAPAVNPGSVTALEGVLRRGGYRDWAAAALALLQRSDAEASPWADLLQQVEQWRASAQRRRRLGLWVSDLHEWLVQTGQWHGMEGDKAGDAVIQALRLADGEHSEWHRLPQTARPIGLADFAPWVSAVLEAGSYRPSHPADAHVVILPLAQMLGLRAAAAVLPGCDEAHLLAAPEPPGFWTAAQRAALGLPSREDLERVQRAAWAQALGFARVDVLWRTADATGEPLLPSPLVQALQLGVLAEGGADVRTWRPLVPAPQERPGPSGACLAVDTLTATAYDDLRHCPYRFFALRQIGLREADELDTEVGKRDFGTWLHGVLRRYHESEPASAQGRMAALDDAAKAQSKAMGLSEDDFLPFAASWPQVRDGYLHWLAQHASSGAHFAQAESDHRVELGSVALRGRIDRIDRLPGQVALVVDYKTEGLGVTRQRVKTPTEDTQLAFYSALLQDDVLQAAYVNLEENATTTVWQDDILAARDALVEGIQQDMAALAAGAPMPALGEGRVCDFCAARGLCRKDFWAA
jgi:ATP-dependent helicase/nuclease subunit B